MVPCVKEHDVVWNYLWFHTYYCQWRKGGKKGRKDNLKGPISSMRFFNSPILTTFAGDIITVINIINEMTAIARSCKSRTHKKRDTICLCSYSPAFLKQTPPNKADILKQTLGKCIFKMIKLLFKNILRFLCIYFILHTLFIKTCNM